MKNKLKEMLLQHKPITEQTFDIDHVWRETVDTGAEDFEEIPEGGTPQEAPTEDETVVDVPAEVEDVEDVPAEEVEDAEVEEDIEDVPAEENSHTIADVIEEAWSIGLNYHNSQINENTKKLNKKLDKIRKS